MKASGSGRWLSVTTVIHIVLASVVISTPVHADQPLHASLEYEILDQPYQNFVNVTPDAHVAVDRNPSSPYYGTIYAVGYGISGWISGWNYTLAVQRSLDGGRSFDGPYSFDICDDPSGGGCHGAEVAVGSNGRIYVASGPFVFRSTDQGLSWTKVATFPDFAITEIATDSDTGTVLVAGIDVSNYNATRTTFDMVVRRSLDEGQTWGPPVIISADETEPGPHIAAWRANVVVAFRSTNPSTGFAAVTAAVSHDGGLTWPVTVAVAPPDVRANLSTPSIAVSPEGVFAVSWSSSVPGSSTDLLATFVSISRDGGDTYSEPLEVSRYQGRAFFGPRNALAFDDRSRLYVTWLATEAHSSGLIYVANSTDLGQHFTNASFVGGRGNESVDQALASGINGQIYLTCLCDHLGVTGWYFRGVAGEATGDLVLGSATVPGTEVGVELVDPSTTLVQMRATWLGSPFVLAELPPNVYEVWIRVGDAVALAGAMPVLTWNRTAFTIHAEGGPILPGTPPFPWPTAAAVGGVVVFLAAALVALQHTRIAREQVLQKKLRLLLYEAIQEDPGSSFTNLRDAMGLRNGVAAYHLSVLEKQGLVHTEKGRRHRWYYPNGDASLWRDLPLSPLQQSLVERVRQAPGIGIRELARNLNCHHASVSYNVRGLAREGLLRTQRTGRKVQCFPMDADGTE